MIKALRLILFLFAFGFAFCFLFAVASFASCPPVTPGIVAGAGPCLADLLDWHHFYSTATFTFNNQKFTGILYQDNLDGNHASEQIVYKCLFMFKIFPDIPLATKIPSQQWITVSQRGRANADGSVDFALFGNIGNWNINYLPLATQLRAAGDGTWGTWSKLSMAVVNPTDAYSGQVWLYFMGL